MLIHVDFTSRFAQFSGSCLQLDDRFAEAKTSWNTPKTGHPEAHQKPRFFPCFIFRFLFAIGANVAKRRFFYEKISENAYGRKIRFFATECASRSTIYGSQVMGERQRFCTRFARAKNAVVSFLKKETALITRP